MKIFAVVLIVMSSAGYAFGQAAVVPPNPVDYGPGRIDASTAYRYIGQTATACGRAVQTDVRAADFVMGVSPYETIALFPPGTAPQIGANYNLKIVCVTGQVEPQDYMGIRAAIRVQNPSQIQLMVYQPPPQPSGPCLDSHGILHGRPSYGGSARPANAPLPPCPL